MSRAYARLEAVPHDWSAVDALEIEVRAGRATGEKVRLRLPSDNPATPGTDRYAAAFVVGWVGWKRLRWTRSDLQAEGKPLGWQQIDNVTLAGERWGKPGAASLWLGEVAIRGHAGK